MIRKPSPAWGIAVTLAFTLGACTTGGDPADREGTATTQSPDGPVGRVVAPTAPADTAGEEPIRVEINPDAVDLRARGFDTAVPLGTRELSIRFFGSVEPCEVVGMVDVSETDEEVIVSLITGSAPNAGDIACIEVAVYKEVVVQLEAGLGNRRIIDTAD